jgi:hypothetical protein
MLFSISISCTERGEDDGHGVRVGVPSFMPLEGQQRLTTLFLLHWYLPWREDEHAHFTGFMLDAPLPELREPLE